MGRLYGLDALRGIAALIVLIYHVAAIFDLGHIPNGHLAVDFFFMLSGYVMARLLGQRERTAAQFLWSRIKRLWPMMAVGTTLGLALLPFELRWWEIVAGYALWPVFIGGFLFPLNPPAWSIFFELYANALHAVMRRALWPAIFGFSLVLLVATGGFFGGVEAHNFFQGFPRVMLSYSLGVMLFQKWRDDPPFKIPSVCGLALLLLLIPIPGQLFHYAFVLLVCPLVVLSGLRSNPPLASAIGATSFPLYAVHYPLLLSAGPWVGSALAIIAAVVIAWIAGRVGQITPMGTNARGNAPS